MTGLCEAKPNKELNGHFIGGLGASSLLSDTTRADGSGGTAGATGTVPPVSKRLQGDDQANGHGRRAAHRLHFTDGETETKSP